MTKIFVSPLLYFQKKSPAPRERVSEANEASNDYQKVKKSNTSITFQYKKQKRKKELISNLKKTK